LNICNEDGNSFKSPLSGKIIIHITSGLADRTLLKISIFLVDGLVTGKRVEYVFCVLHLSAHAGSFISVSLLVREELFLKNGFGSIVLERHVAIEATRVETLDQIVYLILSILLKNNRFSSTVSFCSLLVLMSTLGMVTDSFVMSRAALSTVK
jgi:hypothetical protein